VQRHINIGKGAQKMAEKRNDPADEDKAYTFADFREQVARLKLEYDLDESAHTQPSIGLYDLKPLVVFAATPGPLVRGRFWWAASALLRDAIRKAIPDLTKQNFETLLQKVETDIRSRTWELSAEGRFENKVYRGRRAAVRQAWAQKVWAAHPMFKAWMFQISGVFYGPHKADLHMMSPGCHVIRVSRERYDKRLRLRIEVVLT
jgi:hypothetical protein